MSAKEEVVVMPEMIDAGLEVLWRFNPDYSDAAAHVQEIFEAMMAARKEKSFREILQDQWLEIEASRARKKNNGVEVK